MIFPTVRQNRAIGKKLTTTSATTIYTLTDDNIIVQARAIHIANVTGTAATATITWTDNSESDTYTLVFEKSIAGNDYLHLDDDTGMGFELAVDDKISVTAGTANALHVVMIIYEMGR